MLFILDLFYNYSIYNSINYVIPSGFIGLFFLYFL